jgi:hypothetical protein
MFVEAALRRDEVVECPRNGQTAENLRSELICSMAMAFVIMKDEG